MGVRCPRGAGLHAAWLFARASALTRRTQALIAWGRALLRIESGLSLRTASLEDLLDRAIDGEENRDVRRALSGCAMRMRCDPLESLSSAMVREETPELTRADRAALSPLWFTLGTGDLQDQRSLLSSIRQALDAQREAAAGKERKDRRLYTSLGLLGAGAVFLFLM